MKRKMMILSLLAVILSVGVYAGSERKISIQEYRDKMEAGWIGQIAGVSWAARTEFKFNKQIIPIDETTGMPELMPKWTPSLINNAFAQDDIYVEMTFNFPALSEVCLKLAKTAIEREGGKVVGDDATGHFVIPQKPVTMKPYVSTARPEPIANSRFTAEEIARIEVRDERVKRQFAAFFPGWEIINSADLSVTGNKERQYSAFVSLPRNAESPCVIKKSVDVPAGKKTKLKLTVASTPKIGGPWQLLIRVDMADHFDLTIDGEKKMAWKELEIDLSEFAGKTIDLELYNNPVGDWTKSLAAWKSIDIVSE